MDDAIWWIPDYADQTTLHPVGLTMLVLCGGALLALPRRYTVWALLAMVCFVASAQRVVIFSLDFDLLRIMVLLGWLRIIVRGETRHLVWKPIDVAVLAWSISCLIIHTAGRSTMADLINRLGYTYDTLGQYFLLRCLVRDWNDLGHAVFGFILVSIPLALCFLVENRTGRNAFSVFGGVPAITAVRDGRLRCQGAFSHPILAGCFWAAVVPMVAAGLWAGGRRRTWAIVGTVCALIVVVASASSTPVGAVINAAIAALLFPLRRWMRRIRWGVVIALIGLHLMMKAPVWHLIARLQFVGGSTSWHRYFLIDQAIRHVGEWWLLGSASTFSWGVTDITNQYVLEGLRGGLLTLVCFIIVIALAFQGVGRLWRSVEHDRARLAMAWALGVALWVHCVSFIGVSYFGQTVMLWHFQLAIIGSLAPRAGEKVRAGLRDLVRRRAARARPSVLTVPGGPSPARRT